MKLRFILSSIFLFVSFSVFAQKPTSKTQNQQKILVRKNLLNSLFKTSTKNIFFGFSMRQSGEDSNIVSTSIAGKQAIKFTLSRDQTTRRERSELLTGANKSTRLPFSSADRTRYFGTSIYLPKQFETDAKETSPVVFQFHDLDPSKISSRAPSQALVIRNNHWFYEINFDFDPESNRTNYNSTVSRDLGPVKTDIFTKFVVITKWSTDKPDGYVKVYLNDKLVVDYTGGTTYYDPNGYLPYLKFGIYINKWGKIAPTYKTISNKIEIYHADTRYANSDGSYADVNP